MEVEECCSRDILQCGTCHKDCIWEDMVASDMMSISLERPLALQRMQIFALEANLSEPVAFG